MNKIKHAIIAAAGLGSRLNLEMPQAKTLLDVGGESILSRLFMNLSDVETVTVVTGFEARKVAQVASNLRSDVRIIVNEAYRDTTILDSIVMGAQGLEGDALFMTADTIFTPHIFARFKAIMEPAVVMAGITEAVSEDAIFVHLDDCGKIDHFSYQEVSPFEWANVFYAPIHYFQKKYDLADTRMYQQLARLSDIKTSLIDCCEIDTQADLKQAREFIVNRNLSV